MIILIILLLIILFLIGYIIYKILKYKKLRLDTISLISGQVGGGKSSSGVCRIISMLRKVYFLGRSHKLEHDYIVLANFPLGKLSKNKDYRYIKVFGHKIKCYDLDINILLQVERLPQKEVILVIDEFDKVASQFDFDNPNVCKNMDDFFSNFRQYTESKGYIFAIDQCTKNIFLQIRRRASYCYNMLSCRKLLLLPIVKYEFRKLIISDEISNTIDLTNGYESDIQKTWFLCNPFKYYDSHYKSERYKKISKVAELKFNNVDFKRNDDMKCPKKPIYSEIFLNDNYTRKDFEIEYSKYFADYEKKKQIADILKKVNKK